MFFINAAFGLGENVVQGTINPDAFYVHKPTYNKGFKNVLKRSLGSKEKKMIFTDTINLDNIAVEYTKNIPSTQEEQTHFCITDEEVMVLADYAIKVENHYSKKVGFTKPMDMEWAKDGTDGELYMVQARPETVQSQKKGNILEIYHLKEKGKILVKGSAIGTKIGQGKVHYIKDVRDLNQFKTGEVLVADTTNPDWEPIMKIAAAIITNKGGRTCHAAILSRELGIPAVVGCDNATEVLSDAGDVTVSCADGEDGHVYEGILKYEIVKTNLTNLPKTKQKL